MTQMSDESLRKTIAYYLGGALVARQNKDSAISRESALQVADLVLQGISRAGYMLTPGTMP